MCAHLIVRCICFKIVLYTIQIATSFRHSYRDPVPLKMCCICGVHHLFTYVIERAFLIRCSGPVWPVRQCISIYQPGITFLRIIFACETIPLDAGSGSWYPLIPLNSRGTSLFAFPNSRSQLHLSFSSLPNFPSSMLTTYSPRMGRNFHPCQVPIVAKYRWGTLGWGEIKKLLSGVEASLET